MAGSGQCISNFGQHPSRRYEKTGEPRGELSHTPVKLIFPIQQGDLVKSVGKARFHFVRFGAP